MHLMVEKRAAGGGLRERKKRATRAALAEAAVRLAAEHGADHVTVEAISAAAGVSPRTFFNYFDTRDDAFLAIGPDVGERVRQAVQHAPAELSALEAVREALAVELREIERQHGLWSLHSRVLRTSPHLLVRHLGAHMADETGLAEAIALRVGRGPTAPGFPGGTRPPADADEADDGNTDAGECGAEGDRRRALDLYPRLLAAVAGTAVRVSIEHWCCRQDERAFTEVFRQVFDLLAAGLPAPGR
ncbi:TetR family transcriptional regulator [Streptomyces sp. CRN 30]|uniref:TetR family transcriptional regulator n=1 Tax=Streptomyces sp. CRN 30 TaxID=3075613 RepID=UPI002A81D278|nr:TetR family transcriptional regulator [Streptomyces sp. CRN 30]